MGKTKNLFYKKTCSRNSKKIPLQKKSDGFHKNLKK